MDLECVWIHSVLLWQIDHLRLHNWFYKLNSFIYFPCLHMGTPVPECTHEGQRTAWGPWFFPSTVQALEIELSLGDQHLHLASLCPQGLSEVPRNPSCGGWRRRGCHVISGLLVQCALSERGQVKNSLYWELRKAPLTSNRCLPWQWAHAHNNNSIKHSWGQSPLA